LAVVTAVITSITQIEDTSKRIKQEIDPGDGTAMTRRMAS
jgi:hypothetical protein